MAAQLPSPQQPSATTLASVLTSLTGALRDGYTDEDIVDLRVLADLTGWSPIVIWDYRDDAGVGGSSQLLLLRDDLPAGTEPDVRWPSDALHALLAGQSSQLLEQQPVPVDALLGAPADVDLTALTDLDGHNFVTEDQLSP